jgi:hypothetical protein
MQIPPGPNADVCTARAREAGRKEHSLAWAKFYRPTSHAPAVTTPLSIREIGVDERDVFAATAIAGIGMPTPLTAWLAQIVGRPHWHAYVSFDGEHVQRPEAAVQSFIGFGPYRSKCVSHEAIVR